MESRSVFLRLLDGRCEPCTIALAAASIGTIFGVAVCSVVVVSNVEQKFVWGYFALLALFHIVEFVSEASNHPLTVDMTSFMIPHSRSYAIAHAASLAELIFMRFVIGYSYMPIYLRYFGLFLAFGGLTFRTLSMRHAGSSFTHQVMVSKHETHILVTTGFYGICRHPAYSGYFFFVVGTQLVVGNLVCLVTHATATYVFLRERIIYEESTLIDFFGNRYIEYALKTPSGLPFTGLLYPKPVIGSKNVFLQKDLTKDKSSLKSR